MPDRQAIPKPVFRDLRVFAVDPGLTARFETAVMNETTLHVPWEDLEAGPAGEYVVVCDRDEKGKRLHHPAVDLNASDVLAQSGLPPSDGSPQFRQQMVYAVAMRTIKNFERALGRLVHWPPAHGSRPKYRPQLMLYPHYMEQANAYYDPDGGVRFGYFESGADSPFPGTIVFTCLSQDVIAHQVTHALLAGMNIEFDVGANPDVTALHEGFADLIALFQHFSESDVLREQIGMIGGNLDRRSQLGAVAPQLGAAIGFPDGIRNALGSTDADGNWHPRRPDPKLYETMTEPHARGDLLVGAVFDAFKKIYESRVADLKRIATHGTGVLPEGFLHPDLVDRFTREAAKAARHVLDMCIRALDYMPPLEATFGDFLRAIITADADLVPTDDMRYRVAFVDAFRGYGIGPAGLGTVSVETLRWEPPEDEQETAAVSEFVRTLARAETYWNIPRERAKLWRTLHAWAHALEEELKRSGVPKLGPVDLAQPFEVIAFDLRRRAGMSGELSPQWIVKVLQRGDPHSAGTTLIVDAETGAVRYQIDKAGKHARTRGLLKRADHGELPQPRERPLRIFAFDPSIGIEMESAAINEVTLAVPWERDRNGKDLLQPGPVGEYVEVIDHDPASGAFYAPVDLNDHALLAQNGLPPSESNPQFHQQMVYAVTMQTIRNFERALGRLALWSPNRIRGKDGDVTREEYVQRLRVHPHALREANAYYSPDKKALLFGYFPATADANGSEATPLNVFTCLSHDIVAHECTHALLDGIHRRFNEPSNPDVLAFHEAFADIVALFQHFSFPQALRHQIAATRGDLASQNKLGELAQQFGWAIGNRGALRSAIGSVDPETGEWKPRKPDPADYATVMEPHARGSLLVAAVFAAFLSIYKARIADLLRIASEGTGVLPEGQLHPDLVNRLADEAAGAAQHVLEMCIRALDYCPPVDITFGDYLRAVITADFEFDPVDAEHRRVAFAEAFRRYGIVPEKVRTLSVDGLLWRPAADAPDEDEDVVIDLVKNWATDIDSWNLSHNRAELFELMRAKRAQLHEDIKAKLSSKSRILSGIDPKLKFEVHSIRPSLRIDWNEQAQLQWVIELTQRIPQWFDEAASRNGSAPDWVFRGGCTLLVEADTGKVRYSIKKPLNKERKERQHHFVLDEANASLAATYFGDIARDKGELFAVLHRFS
ncbi:MAG: hypothetical protein ACJ74B_05135 [Gaiellaceae bacterium]